MLRFLTLFALLMDEAGDKGGGGGTPPATPPAADDKDKKIADLEKQLNELKAKQTPPKQDDPSDLQDKANKEREQKEKRDVDQKRMEAAVRFNVGAKDWVKTHASLLPKDVEEIINLADKENYAGAVEKDNAIKSGIIKSFFSQQANMDLLTASQKTVLEDYLKLTNTCRQERAQSIYDSIFEPTFEMLKRLKRAESLKDGHSASDSETAHKEKLMKLSKKHYLGEK